ncbi:MAG: hypothetical protein ACOCWI_00920 [Bacillota bacterium]
MKKFICLLLIIILMCFVFSLSSCNKPSDSFLTYDYNSKIDGYRNVFTLTHINAVDKKNNSVRIADRHFDEFDKRIRSSDYFIGVDKVYDVNQETFLYQGNECYILTNGDSYFALGEKQNGHYQLAELKAKFNFYDFENEEYVFKIFSIFPYLNEYTYNAMPPDLQPEEPFEDILVWIPYEWNYVKLFYSRLEYAQIDEEQRIITINAFTGSTDTEFNEQSPTWIDEMSFSFVSEDNHNYIKFPVSNFTTIDNDMD